MAPGHYLPPVTWGAEYYDQGTTSSTSAYYGSNSYGSSVGYFTVPTQEPLPVGPTKAERARSAMRAHLASLAPSAAAAAKPSTPLLAARDPLRHHRQRCARRQPRLSWVQRSA